MPERSSNRSRRSARIAGRRAWTGWLLALVVVAAMGVVAWSQLGPQAGHDDPNVVANLTSMVGRRAPPFTLADSEGAAHTVAPGDGRRYVLIFHMGSV
jgi:hypothetical protein